MNLLIDYYCTNQARKVNFVSVNSKNVNPSDLFIAHKYSKSSFRSLILACVFVAVPHILHEFTTVGFRGVQRTFDSSVHQGFLSRLHQMPFIFIELLFLMKELWIDDGQQSKFFKSFNIFGSHSTQESMRCLELGGASRSFVVLHHFAHALHALIVPSTNVFKSER